MSPHRRFPALCCALLLTTVGACSSDPEAPRRSSGADAPATEGAPTTGTEAATRATPPPLDPSPTASLPHGNATGSEVVGVAGGTVEGPDGARVTIPPGALGADTLIAIERSSKGAPGLPSTMTPVGQIYAFTPHGTTFATPVTVSLPYDPAAVPDGFTPGLYKTDAEGAWEALSGVTANADTVTAPVTSFSNLNPGVERRAPQREWVFTIDALSEPGRSAQPIHGDDHDQAAWLAVHPRELVEPGAFELLRVRHQTALEVFSGTDGVTFWASADEAGKAQLTQTQGFYKRAANATLKLVITGAVLEAGDENHALLPSECPLRVFCVPFNANVRFSATAHDRDWELLKDPQGRIALHADGIAVVSGRDTHWDFVTPDVGFAQQVWTESDFEFTKTPLGEISETHPLAHLTHPITLDVDLSTVGVDEAFYVTSVVAAQALNRRGRESAVNAYIRDPSETGGTQVISSGLELTDEPIPPPPPGYLAQPAPCPTGPDADPEAGVLQFSAPSYVMSESHIIGTDDVLISRSGGATGLVSATISTAGGSANPGQDYEPLDLAMYFSDGDTDPRTVPLEILGNATPDADRTVELSLSDPGGCASLGAQSSAVLTIRDDDQPAQAPQRFTVGGTVEGLIGTGLVLDNNHGLFLEIFGNGPFTFSDLPLPSGSPYSVGVFNRPHDPTQECTVTDGEGTFTDHNVTDVVVSCV